MAMMVETEIEDTIVCIFAFDAVNAKNQQRINCAL
jgi:hypothetical protein